MQPFDCRVTVQISTGTRIQILSYSLRLDGQRCHCLNAQLTTSLHAALNSEGQFFEAYLDRRMRRHGG